MYEVGDKVYFKQTIFMFEAVILDIDDDEHYNIYIEYTDFEKQKHKIWVNERHLCGFAKTSEKHLKQQIKALLKDYTIEEILGVCEEMKERKRTI